MTGKGPAPRAGRLASEALERCSSARIVSAHERVASLLLEDGSIVTLLPAGTPLHPWALAGAADPARLRANSTVSIRDGKMFLGDTSIVLSDLYVCELTIPRRAAALTPSDMAILGKLAAAIHSTPPSLSPFDGVIRQVLARFVDDGNVRLLSGLIGVGSGLTPSGDDVLLGMIAAADTLRGALPEASRIHGELAAMLSAPLDARTPRLSAQMLHAAAHGRYPEPLLELTDAIASPAMPRIERAAAAVRSLGHSSGTDMLNGFATGLHRSMASPSA